MSRIRGALQSPWVRGGFVVVALAAAAIAVWLSWPDVYSALTRLDPLLLVAACLVSPAYLVATMLVWRVLLSDLGSHLTPRDAFAVFFVSQLGKYLPGSFWNVVAAAELGADRDVPRRRSLTGMAVALLLSLVTGLGLGVVGLLMSPQEARGRFDAVLWLLPFLVVLALPPVVNRLVGWFLRVLRRPPLEHALTLRGTLGALGWSVAGWLLAGLQIWLLGVAAGMEASATSYLICAGGYALAWSLGFLFVPVPAGVGVREVVLVAVLSGVLDHGGVLVVVLISRAILTVVDIGLAGTAAALSRSRAGRQALDDGPPPPESQRPGDSR